MVRGDEPRLFPVEEAAGKHTQRNGGLLMTFRESYSLIVLRDGNADHMGKGWAELRSPQRKLRPDKVEPVNGANLTVENSNSHAEYSTWDAKASNSEELCGVIPHAGFCEGSVG